MSKLTRFASIAGACISLLGPGFALGQEKGIKWVPGPFKADLSDVASVQVEKNYLFADQAEARKIMELMGNRPSGRESGLIMPSGKDQDWFITFDYSPAGYVPDDEKDKIDEAAILETIRKGTEAGNEYRKEKGFKPLHVTGWFEKPHYDPRTNNLVWALEAQEEGGPKVVNYDVRLLGRRGYMSATLVTDPESLTIRKPDIDRVLTSFSYKAGSRYTEFIKGDKLAGYGLTALVASGAGVAAVKLGLLATLGKLLMKAWKLVIAGFVALGAGLKRLFGRQKQKTFDAP